MAILNAYVFLVETHWMVGYPLLPNPDFPIVFDSIDGLCDQDVGGTSYLNVLEADAVVNWIGKLTRTTWKGRDIKLQDIGVISPYKSQCNRIRSDLRNRGLEEISVGSAELYQGQERRIIIVSTVRKGNQLGFVSCPQVIFHEFHFCDMK